MRTLPLLATQVLLVAAGLGAYHLWVKPEGGAEVRRTAALEEEVRALRAEVARVAAQQAASAPRETSGQALAAVEALESRVRALEGRLIPAAAEAGSRSDPPLPAAGHPFTEEQIAAFRALLDEAEARRAQERETASIRQMLRAAAPDLGPDAENAVVSLLQAFMRQIRELFPGGSAGSTPEERAATFAKANQSRARLEEDLARLLPHAALEKLGPSLPGFPGPNPPKPPRPERGEK